MNFNIAYAVDSNSDGNSSIITYNTYNYYNNTYNYESNNTNNINENRTEEVEYTTGNKEIMKEEVESVTDKEIITSYINDLKSRFTDLSIFEAILILVPATLFFKVLYLIYKQFNWTSTSK